MPPERSRSTWTLSTRPVTVTYWDGVENVKNELLTKKLIPEYQQLHPNVTIKYETISGLGNKLPVALATGTAPTIFTLPDFLLPMAARGERPRSPCRRRPGDSRTSRAC